MFRAVFAALGMVLTFLPAESQAQLMDDRLVRSRAVEAAIWGMPAVNTDLMRQEMLTKTPGKVNQLIYWGRPLDYRNQTLTPNPDAIYFMAFFDTKTAGPIVLEVPPGDAKASLTGNIMTVWQVALEDVGLLGLDKGAGGKFLILPPDFEGEVPVGYTVLRPDTFGSYALLRSNLKSHSSTDVDASVTYGKRVKIYPLSAVSSPPETVFTDVKDISYDSTIRYDLSFYETLNRIVQDEPWIERDRAMIDQLRTIGIEKGKPFAPNETTQAILGAAVQDAKQILEQRYDAGFPPFYPDSQWMYPTLQAAIEGQGTGYAERDKYAVDARALLYTYGYIALKRPGSAQFYLISIRDKTGARLDGAKTYRLRVPAHAPVQQYWSVTAYDRETHALIKGMERASRASNSGALQKNPDGSTDIIFGPVAPAGLEANWVPTDAARDFELMFRVYGPTAEFFDKSWILPDVEPVSP